MDTSAGFGYSELPDAGTHIRLIRVKDAKDGRTVHCDLSIWSINSTPPYNAISYTWGNPADVGMITLNGVDKEVRTNCEYALRQAYWHDCSAYIWVDALCINQDDTREKNVRVAMMGEIYKRAEYVLACVGTYHVYDDSEYLWGQIRKNERLYTLISETVDLDKRADIKDSKPCTLQNEIWKCLLRYLPLGFKRLFQAHDLFFGRPYFHRVWVLQEAFMAQEIIICCDHDRLPFHLFPAHLWMISLMWNLRFHSLSHMLNSAMPDRYWTVSLLWLFTRRTRAQKMFSPVESSTVVDVGRRPNDGFLSLEKVLTSLFGRQCQDRRDMIYATLPIVNWHGQSSICPDYDKSCFQLGLDVLTLSASTPEDVDISLASTLVDHLELHRESFEAEERGFVLSILGPDPSAPIRSRTQNRHIIRRSCSTLTSWPSRPGLYVQAVTHSGSTCFRGPIFQTVDAQEGDLLVQFFSFIGLQDSHTFTIVAREQSEGCLKLIGFTALKGRRRDRFDRIFMAPLWLHLDSEDFLMFQILHKSLSQIRSRPGDELNEDKTRRQLLSRRFCRYEGSSYAMKEDNEVSLENKPPEVTTNP